MAAAAPPAYPANLQIPVDLFASRNRWGLICRGDLRFTDASGNLVFVVGSYSSNSAVPPNKRLLLDPAGNVLITMDRNSNGSWQGFKQDTQLIFRVERKLKTFSKTELEVFLVGENRGGLDSSFKMIGCPFQRSCTIYRGNSIVAQTKLMYKLGKVYIGRCRFQTTIFPGFVDCVLIAALIVIFFD
ncbi:protein LURP-one-related 7 [Malania oleifera]|uniref:protein LURP-one-related 7 n=1 Tax=Malania oleifera TaxID=397392 RepID=UPI0025AE5019|nr:protein LURP-one-related 7 [Malania oleifera]